MEEVTGQEKVRFCSLAWKEEETERAGEEVREVWLVEGVPASWLLFSIECGWLAVELGV